MLKVFIYYTAILKTPIDVRKTFSFPSILGNCKVSAGCFKKGVIDVLWKFLIKPPLVLKN